MQRWEYMVLLCEADFIQSDDLDQMGQDGWELVSVTTSVKQISSHSNIFTEGSVSPSFGRIMRTDPVASESSNSESFTQIDNVAFCNAYFKRPLD